MSSPTVSNTLVPSMYPVLVSEENCHVSQPAVRRNIFKTSFKVAVRYI